MSETTSPCTRAVRAGIESDTQHGAVVPPLHLSTNYSFEGFGKKRPYDYSRSGNPTRDLLAGALAELEQGAGAVITASGMAAVALALELVPAGATVLAAHDCYGGTWRLLDAWAKKGRFALQFADLTDPAALAAGLAAKPALVWVETPSNPLLRITDIRHVAQAAHAVGALVVVDNTFLSPALQQPLALGADVVVHSTTKYINGHSDVVGGAVVARDPAVADQLKWWGNCNGLTGAPFDSYLTLRGLRTLGVRLRQHQENATRIADHLNGHAAVRKVYYPGLAANPYHALAARQQQGFGAMLSFELEGDETQIAAFVDGLEYFSLAESLGGVESLVAHPASMTHAAMAPEARHKAGIADTLLRLSVGIEEGDDLLRDLDAGLARAVAADKSKRRVSA
ncbi:MAG: O-succinylhomoserine (thiol)-lyase [Rhodanobacter sp. 68-29]|uniref:cystathionine gamma-synthase n=1 Tax=Rhodanobacter sp. PCA2 TaxID=2006117 RepID=UPI00086E37E7|nr:cystathionine gamma-synthase [Rhodanobacter sp. PCA2]MBA2077487.1 O-succinylhomoserine (thiol)-lyase [Rhodanobacter sp. PCA2]MBN8923443.1 cystathionine gamma-synthase [Rhodanobacter sp.]ODU73923.1 MAG: O-succinylhomoserine (thiol)-lyase [Rhodanobacter sp. SCN 69-32]OJY55308.1 MAG: O-succinylhomoserine (thiol)-lyase [Rhodanobacter sp. 68-29]